MKCSIHPMSLDEAIQHCLENVERLKADNCDQCANEHHQLASWLIELKERRQHDKTFIESTCTIV